MMNIQKIITEAPVPEMKKPEFVPDSVDTSKLSESRMSVSFIEPAHLGNEINIEAHDRSAEKRAK